jgi:hypothetical protein
MDKHIKIAESIAKGLDDKFNILGFRFGIDPIIGFVPILGDVIPALFTAYLIWIGSQIGLPGNQIGRMALNVILDFLAGFIPGPGDVADFFVKANKRNFAILMDHYKSSARIIEGTIVK